MCVQNPVSLVSSTIHSSPYLPHTMSIHRIDAPAAHSIFFTPYGKTYTSSLSGAISLPSASFRDELTAPLVSVSLTRFVTLSTKRKAIPQLVKRKKHPEATYAEVVACAEISRPTGATIANGRNQPLSLNFSLAVPTFLEPDNSHSDCDNVICVDCSCKDGRREKI